MPQDLDSPAIVAGAGAQLTAEDYQRAEQMLPHFRSGLALRCELVPSWNPDGTGLSYSINTEHGREHVSVDAESLTTHPAFDRDALAAAYAAASGTPITATSPAFERISIDADGVEFVADGIRWRYSEQEQRCLRLGEDRSARLWENASPDGRWVAFVREHDLWLRETATGDERRLTHDGEALRPWAAHADQWSGHTRRGLWNIPTTKPSVLWSPDSRTIFTHRSDDRGVYRMPFVESSPGGRLDERPRLRTHAYALPGDEVVPTGEFAFIDVETGQVRHTGVEYEHTFLSPVARRRVWWSTTDDGPVVYYLERSRDRRSITLFEISATEDRSRTVLTESASAWVDVAPTISDAPIVRVLSGRGQVVWYSERDGYGHLYLYDLGSGELVRRLTEGTVNVVRIVGVNEEAGLVHVLVAGLDPDNPTRRAVASVGLDDGRMTVLSAGDRDHDVLASPRGELYIDIASTPVHPPVFTLRSFGDDRVLELERGDVSRLEDAGWTAPEPFTVLAADGVTPLHGLLYRPWGFDPSRKYPVIDHPYPGPQISRVAPSFVQFAEGPQAEALAALGFAVMIVDGRGTPGRGRAFLDVSYGNLGIAGTTDDHVATLHQLAESRPWLDLDRVGVYGLSGGAFAGVRMMADHPDVYSVVVAEAGNHDNRFYHSMWGETYQGPFDEDEYRRASNLSVADRIEGKLFLVHGELDDNVPMYLTLKLIERLIELNKDPDVLIIPGADHLFSGKENYVVRRRWDYLVRELMGAEPPSGYRLAPFPANPEKISSLAF